MLLCHLPNTTRFWSDHHSPQRMLLLFGGCSGWSCMEMHWQVFSLFLWSSRNVPNRYTFPCPYCPEKNFDQEGLVEHCKLSHSTDTKSVVRETFKKYFLWEKSQTYRKITGIVQWTPLLYPWPRSQVNNILPYLLNPALYIHVFADR